MLFNWIKEYKENCYNIVERKRGRPTMYKKIKPTKLAKNGPKKLSFNKILAIFSSPR